ncbi:MAG: LexA family transcriptional regulator [Candidatus Pacebacteria bacterium]|nr:LexA family transcriptional regulator [Candidatus Paceibacterota bacterium]
MRDEQILSTFFIEHNRMPTYEEMKNLFSVASKNTVSYRVNKLVESGFLVKEGTRVSLSETGSIIRLGTVQAGFPTAADEDVANDVLSLDDFLIDKRGSTYMLEVMGESMKDAGILEGDLVLVERGKAPRKGDIVLALVDHEYTLKYLDQEKGRPVLVPANRTFKKIYPDLDTFKVEAVLKAVIRKYR